MTTFCENLETHGRPLDGDSRMASFRLRYQVVKVTTPLSEPFSTRQAARNWLQGFAESFAVVDRSDTWDWARLQHGTFLRIEVIE